MPLHEILFNHSNGLFKWVHNFNCLLIMLWIGKFKNKGLFHISFFLIFVLHYLTKIVIRRCGAIVVLHIELIGSIVIFSKVIWTIEIVGGIMHQSGCGSSSWQVVQIKWYHVPIKLEYMIISLIYLGIFVRYIFISVLKYKGIFGI